MRTKSKAHAGAENPAPRDRSGAAKEKRCIESSGYTGAQTHDAERKTDL